jgi:hypothetical protein
MEQRNSNQKETEGIDGLDKKWCWYSVVMVPGQKRRTGRREGPKQAFAQASGEPEIGDQGSGIMGRATGTNAALPQFQGKWDASRPSAGFGR